MKTTEQNIKDMAQAMGLPYILGSLAQINVALDKIQQSEQYPLCLNIQATEGKLTFEDGAYYADIKDTERVAVGFADSIPLDYDAESVEAQVEALKLLAKRFVAKLNRSGAFEPVTEVIYSVMFDKYDANMVVLMLDFQLRQTAGECVDEMEA